MALGFGLGVLLVTPLAALQVFDHPAPRPASHAARPKPPAPVARAARVSAPIAAPVAAVARPQVQARLVKTATLKPAAAQVGPATHAKSAKAKPKRHGLPPAQVFDPVWLSRPSQDDIARLYPERARQSGVAGSATLDCVVSREGALSACAVVSERPASQGFGQAALKLAARFQAGPATAAGWPTAGYRVRVPIEWSGP
jgi:protein TonB